MIMQPDYQAPSPAALPDVLSDLTLRQLLSFRAVAEVGSFHGAADALEYTQSAVSQHVAALETTLGVRLLERSRGRRTVSLTEAGTLFLRHVVAITNRLQAARADLLAYAAGEVGTLRVGVYASVGARILPEILRRFARAWPGVEVQLSEAPDQGLLDAIELGTLDLTFGILPLPAGPFEAEELARDPYVLVVARNTVLPAYPSLDDVAAQRLITFRSAGATSLLIDDLRRRGLRLDFALQTDDNSTVQAMAAAGLGAALVPLLAVKEDDPAVRILPLDVPPRRIALIWHGERYRTPASRAFAEIAAEVCVPLAAELASFTRS
ncbi:MAG: LysR family transcriptional regulator [Chloroflexota bacterium]